MDYRTHGINNFDHVIRIAVIAGHSMCAATSVRNWRASRGWKIGSIRLFRWVRLLPASHCL